MQEQSLLRTAAETTKVLKLIRSLVNDTTWMDYIRHQNKDNVVEFVVKQLCTSTKSLIQIKAEAKGQDL